MRETKAFRQDRITGHSDELRRFNPAPVQSLSNLCRLMPVAEIAFAKGSNPTTTTARGRNMPSSGAVSVSYITRIWRYVEIKGRISSSERAEITASHTSCGVLYQMEHGRIDIYTSNSCAGLLRWHG